jgi:hypothetical protein
MTDRPAKIRRLSELPRDVTPPRDGWPALEARLRDSGTHEPAFSRRPRRPQLMRIAALAAVIAAVLVGVSIDRWVLSGAPRAPQREMASRSSPTPARMPVAYITDPRYQREREALLRSLTARLAKLPPPTRTRVLQSLATIHQSMRQIQQALGRQPGNALLQELLIDSYQNEMQLLSTVQEASGGNGET